MKNRIWLILAAVLMICGFAGCGEQAPNEAEGDEVTPAADAIVDI